MKDSRTITLGYVAFKLFSRTDSDNSYELTIPVRHDTIPYIYVRPKDDEVASLVVSPAHGTETK